MDGAMNFALRRGMAAVELHVAAPAYLPICAIAVQRIARMAC